jgi:hypothetical protein
MALYCKKCEKELAFLTLMKSHVDQCYGIEKKTGDFKKADWVKAKSSPEKMAEYYFTTVNPATAGAELYRKAKDVIWDALYHDGVRPSVQGRLQGMLTNPIALRDFDHRNFEERLEISGMVDNEMIYYRKMGGGEYAAAMSGDAGPFAATFAYTNTDNYRYWVSSSLKKVEAFGNENAADNGDVIVRIIFKSSPLTKFTIKAHQERGVQTNTTVVAIHREGFAEIGSISTAADVLEITTPMPKLDYNLGFTATHAKDMKDLYVSFVRL